LSHKHEKSTIWGGKFLPQNREVFMVLGGSGNLSLWNYKNPESRTATDDDGNEFGVVGTVEKLQDSQLGDQPVSGFDWSPDKTGLVSLL
jgi:WD repeat-containing protein 92